MTNNIMKARMEVTVNLAEKIYTRGPGALYRAQEYHCNLVLFFF